MSTPTLDPFAPPVSAIGPAVSLDPEGDFFAVFRRWEKYRLVYNGLLGVITVPIVATTSPLRVPQAIFTIFACAIGANLCFCLGPVLNGYAWWMGLRSRWVGRVILAAGTLLSILLTIGVLAAASIPNQP